MQSSNVLLDQPDVVIGSSSERTGTMSMVATRCCVCDTEDASPLAVGEDFEYRTSDETFLAMRCTSCGLVYLNPRPSVDEVARIYPPDYHAFEFSDDRYGFVYKVRRRLEARRLLSWCRDLNEDARILDVGCGDGFHLHILRDFGKPGWQLEGVDSDDRAVSAATEAGLTVHSGSLDQLDLPSASYDLALLIQTIEHVADPPALLRTVRSLLRPGGSVVIVTDNTGSPAFEFFKERHWGGYHFPRHWNLFNAGSLRGLAAKAEMEVVSLSTLVSPVNWVYSLRNTLVDWNKPKWLVNRFSLESAGSLSAFTVVDLLHKLGGRGSLLRAILRRPTIS